MSSTSEVKARLIACCDELAEIVKERAVEYGDEVLSNLDALKQNIETYVFKIYLVGPFSCGKSSLLNRWLGIDVLSTGLTPETAVSTELCYGETERMELYTLARPDIVDETLYGLTEENMVRVRERANRQEISNVVLHVNHARLKDYRDLCLVDMPGLSSNNPAHDAALKRFVQEPQRVGIFCCQMGHFDDICLNFVKLLSNFGKVKILLTHADTKPQSEHEECIAHVCGQIYEKIGREVECGIVSLDSTDAFARMLEAYREQKDRFLVSRFAAEIKAVAGLIEGPLRRALLQTYDGSAVEEALARLEEVEASIPEMIRDAEENMRSSMRSAASDVASRVRAAAFDQQAACSQGGPSAASQLKSVIEATISYAIPKVVQRSVKDANAKADEFLDAQFDSGVVETSDLSTAVEPVDVIPTAELQPTEKKGGEFANWLGGLVTGNFTPMQFGMMAVGDMLLGPVGVFIGSVGSLLLSWKIDEDSRSRQESQYREMVEQMVANTRPAIEQSLQRTCDQYLDGLRAAAEKKVGSLREQMLQLKAEAAAGEKEWNERQDVRRRDLEKVSQILTTLEAMHG